MRPELLCVVGPTASGKTALSIELALRYGGEVVSCDSMQVYRGMDIGSAKPDMRERRGVRHHMLDVADLSESYSAARYAREASDCIEDILSRNALPVVCGGTGLYLDALLRGLHDAAGQPDGQLRARLEQRADADGTEAMHGELESVDPESARRISHGDRRRIVRALEVYYQTGIPLSKHHEESRNVPPRWNSLVLGIRFADRGLLYERIDRRVEKMMEDGLAGEAAALARRDPPPCRTAMQAIGYKELIPPPKDDLELEMAIERIKLATRHLAKRQITWFAKTPDVRWLDGDGELFVQATQIVERCGLP